MAPRSRTWCARCVGSIARSSARTRFAGGALSRFERRQGYGYLWITGASASHEAVDNIVDYNSRLADRMAWAFAGKDPSGPDALAQIADKYRWRLDSV